MTMAYDASQTPPSRLDDATLDALRAALRSYQIDDTATQALQAVLHRMASEARDQAMMPEHLLIALKGVWRSLPEVRAVPKTARQVRLLQRAVTMCIEEYFSV